MKLHIFTEKVKGISLNNFLPFDELSHILRQCSETDIPSSNANSMLHRKTCHFLLSSIRAMSVKKMQMTYSNRNQVAVVRR